jgi:CMP-N-acetylneuraminic acid synthetase
VIRLTENSVSKSNKQAPKRIAIIPARGGSKRIPGKNLAKISGVPIIDYPIRTAIDSHLFDSVLVSSDDSAILDHVSAMSGVSTNRRPKALSDDFSTVYSVLRYEVERLRENGQEFDEVWLLSATACLLEVTDLLKMSEFLDQDLIIESLLGVSEYQVPIQWAMSLKQDGKLTSIDFKSFLNRSQDLVKYYHDAGCIAAFRNQVFQKHLEGVPEGEFYAFVLDPNKGLDIDHPSDLILAEALLSTREIPSL